MLERCIMLEPNFVPAYLELAKVRSGLSVGELLKKVSKLTPSDAEHLTRYGNWLSDNRKFYSSYTLYINIVQTYYTYSLQIC